jgi:hypothetical protein
MAGVALFWLGFKVFVGALGNIPFQGEKSAVMMVRSPFKSVE